MNIIKKIFSGKSRDKPVNKISDNRYNFYVGTSSSGKRVTE
ncbi:MAG: hypothetical protein Q4A42_00030 [Tissierellia bacterium]|nr:hypothetical protein [Tissierellia bacterium]